jgi:Na+/melibiose symporter-like transporter
MDALAPVLPAMLFFFLCSALPDDGTVWYQYTYGLLENSLECVQYMSLSGMVGRFLSCLAYARWCSNRNVRQVFLLSTVSCVAAGLPRLLLAPPVAPLPVSVCTFLTAESFVTGFTAEFALLQLLVVATFYCPSGKDVQGLTYALFLSFMDFGGVVSGLLASAVVTALGIVPDPVTKRIDWSNLWLVVVIAAASQLLVLVFLCVLPEKVHTEDRGYRSPSADGTEKLPLLAHADGVDYDRLEDDRRA